MTESSQPEKTRRGRLWAAGFLFRCQVPVEVSGIGPLDPIGWGTLATFIPMECWIDALLASLKQRRDKAPDDSEPSAG